MMTKLDHALELAAKGFHVFPLCPGEKLPAIKDFPNKATRDEAYIKNWWGFNPEYNIGISTSAYGNNKALLVVDVDNKGDKRGDDSLLMLEAEGLDFPPTFKQITPTGGYHLIYMVESAVRQGSNVLGRGLDIRSKGGYIVGAGSVLDNGAAYTLRDCEYGLRDAPGWLVGRCGVARSKKPRSTGDALPDQISTERSQRRAVDYLRDQAPLAVEGDGGDATTYKVAARVKDFGVDRGTCWDLMLEHWNDRCSPPWAPEELQTKINNAYEYGIDAPGSAAPELEFDPVPEPTTGPPTLHPFDKLNKEYAFVVTGGGHHILWETFDAEGRYALEHLAEGSFHRMHAAEMMMVSDSKSEPVTKLWMNSPRRRSYRGLCFRPGQKTPAGWYNMWRGFAVQPSASTAGSKSLDMFLDHARNNVCCGDESLFNWLIGFFAHMIQRPWEKPLVALVFRGGKGVGKNALVERVGSLLGGHFLLTSNRRYLVGNFNGHLEKLLFFTLDEAFWSGDKQAEGQLKDLITGKHHVIEHKGKEPYTVENRTRIAIIGNEDWLVPASHDERRFAVFNVGDGRKQDRDFFQTMRSGMELGGYSSLLKYLQDFDIEGIDVNEAPTTSALLDQKTSSLEPVFQWWLDCLEEARLLGSEFTGWPSEIECERFRSAFRQYSKQRNIRGRIPDDRTFGRLFKKCAPGHAKTKARQGENTVYVYRLGDIDACRRDWETFIGHKGDWE